MVKVGETNERIFAQDEQFLSFKGLQNLSTLPFIFRQKAIFYLGLLEFYGRFLNAKIWCCEVRAGKNYALKKKPFCQSIFFVYLFHI